MTLKYKIVKPYNTSQYGIYKKVFPYIQTSYSQF